MDFDKIYKAASIFSKVAQVSSPQPAPLPGGGAEPLSNGNSENYKTDPQASAIQNAIQGMLEGFNMQKYNSSQSEDPGSDPAYLEFVRAAQKGITINVEFSNGNYNIEVLGTSPRLTQEIQTYLATHLPVSSYQGKFNTNVTWAIQKEIEE